MRDWGKKKKALNILKKIDLVNKKDKYPDELSGGQRQRVAIARTILMNPNVILLDEPTSALDNEMKQGVLDLIYDLVKENMTIIIVSHEEDFVQKISDRIFEMKEHTLEEVWYGKAMIIDDMFIWIAINKLKYKEKYIGVI